MPGQFSSWAATRCWEFSWSPAQRGLRLAPLGHGSLRGATIRALSEAVARGSSGRDGAPPQPRGADGRERGLAARQEEARCRQGMSWGVRDRRDRHGGPLPRARASPGCGKTSGAASTRSLRSRSRNGGRGQGASQLLEKPSWSRGAHASKASTSSTRVLRLTLPRGTILGSQQRLFLECSWEALENAGHDSERFAGVIGIVAGISQSSYLMNYVQGIASSSTPWIAEDRLANMNDALRHGSPTS